MIDVPSTVRWNRNLYKDFTEEEVKIYEPVIGKIAQSPEAIVSLIRAVQYIVNNGIPGAFVECGVWHGGGAAVMIRTLLGMAARHDSSRVREVFLYDTFQGFPRPDDRDFEYEVGPALNQWLIQQTEPYGDKGSMWMNVCIEEVIGNIERWCQPYPLAHFVQGMVEDTIPRQLPHEIALARLDTDFYQSTLHELNHVWPVLASGGVLIIDDYGCFAGSKQATDEFLDTFRWRPYLHRVDEHVRLIVKP